MTCLLYGKWQGNWHWKNDSSQVKIYYRLQKCGAVQAIYK
jgi:hypothetical protein